MSLTRLNKFNCRGPRPGPPGQEIRVSSPGESAHVEYRYLVHALEQPPIPYSYMPECICICHVETTRGAGWGGGRGGSQAPPDSGLNLDFQVVRVCQVIRSKRGPQTSHINITTAIIRQDHAAGKAQLKEPEDSYCASSRTRLYETRGAPRSKMASKKNSPQ